MRCASLRSRLGLGVALAVSAADACAALAAPVRASDWIVNGGSSPSLTVDAHGNAQVSWSSGGARTYLVAPPSGRVYHARLGGPDTSKRAAAGGLANALAVRVTAPTAITLALSGTRLTGTVTFHGAPVSGTSHTPSGAAMRIYVYVDCLGSAASPNGWSPLLGVAPAADGSFALALRSGWTGRRYRATVAGPNLGATLAPDAVAYAAGSG